MPKIQSLDGAFFSVDEIKQLAVEAQRNNKNFESVFKINQVSTLDTILQLISIIQYHETEKEVLDRPSRYHVDVSKYQWIDVYDLYDLYKTKSHRVAHALKKLLVPGGRSGDKDYETDIRDAHWSLESEIKDIEKKKKHQAITEYYEDKSRNTKE